MTRNYIGGWQRPQYGFTSTWRNDAGELLTLTRVGAAREALRELIAELKALDPSFRLLCYSTPDSILTDLHGRTPNRNRLITPERNALALVGRLDLLAPAVGAHQSEAALDGSRPGLAG